MRTLIKLGLALMVIVALIGIASGAEKKSPRQHDRGPVAGITARDIEGAIKIGTGLWKRRPGWLFRPSPAAKVKGDIEMQRGAQPPTPLARETGQQRSENYDHGQGKANASPADDLPDPSVPHPGDSPKAR